MRIFPFIAEGHPFWEEVEGFRERLAQRGHADTRGAVVTSEIRGLPGGAGGFLLDRFYCSVQRWPERGPAFRTDSLCYARADGEARWYRYPCDPYLAAVGPYLAGRGLVSAADGLDVLRYVPLRRFTFRAPRRDGRPGREIGKFKRRSRLAESYTRMEAVAQAVARTPPGFCVPAPGGTEPEHSLYFQDEALGRDLATLAHLDPAALLRAAEVLAAFHAVPAPAGLPAVDEAGFHAVIARDLDWIAFHAPDLAGLAASARRALRRAPPVRAAATCHGDFVASHVLADGGVTVIDLDLAHRGDPYREVAMLLASLPVDAPGADADEGAIVAAYEERAGAALDPRRLAWHRVAAEAYHLALAFSKDRPVVPSHLARAVDRMRDAA